MKKIIILAIVLICFSCTRKTEFVQSKVRLNLFLIKNPPKNDGFPTLFYSYTWDTSYFLDHEEDPGGFSSEELDNYREDHLASLIVSQCKNDTTKLIGELIFTKNPFKADTIIYKCD